MNTFVARLRSECTALCVSTPSSERAILHAGMQTMVVVGS